MLPVQVFQQRSAGQRGCSPTLLPTGPFSPTISNTLGEEICFQLPSTDAALPSRSEASWSCSCSLGHHHGGDVPLPCTRGWRRRHPALGSSDSAGASPLCLILGTRLGFTETHWIPPAAPLPKRVGIPPAPAQQLGHALAGLRLRAESCPCPDPLQLPSES